MSNNITFPFQLISKTETREEDIVINRLFIAGWTGRNKAKMEEHIVELEELGIKRPSRTPVFYRASFERLTQREHMQSPGNFSSGEVEFILLAHNDTLWVGIGSDHTDREVETYGITVSKHMCDKPIANTLWPMAEVAPHWDQLQLKSYAVDGGERCLYQDGGVASMLTPDDLLAEFRSVHGEDFQQGDIIFCGTMPAIGGIKPAERFEFEISDPVMERKISHGYDIEVLPIND